MVPVPSVTPKPLVACAEYMATTGAARRQRRHGCPRWFAGGHLRLDLARFSRRKRVSARPQRLGGCDGDG